MLDILRMYAYVYSSLTLRKAICYTVSVCLMEKNTCLSRPDGSECMCNFIAACDGLMVFEVFLPTAWALILHRMTCLIKSETSETREKRRNGHPSNILVVPKHLGRHQVMTIQRVHPQKLPTMASESMHCSPVELLIACASCVSIETLQDTCSANQFPPDWHQSGKLCLG